VNPEHLAEMANDIANFFAAEPDREAAINGVSGHLKKFWDPRMRRQIVTYLREHGGGELSELARAGVSRLAELDAAATKAAGSTP
jgi:formate dehydrogenase subunit delta